MLAIRPGQRAGVSARVGNDLIERHTGDAALATELGPDYRKGLAGIARVVGEAGSTHPVRLFLSADTDDIRMLSRLMGGVEDCHRARAGGDDGSVRKTDPLALVLREELIADRPVCRLVLAPVGMDLASDIRGQAVRQAFHGLPHVRRWGWWYSIPLGKRKRGRGNWG